MLKSTKTSDYRGSQVGSTRLGSFRMFKDWPLAILIGLHLAVEFRLWHAVCPKKDRWRFETDHFDHRSLQVASEHDHSPLTSWDNHEDYLTFK